MDNSWAKRLWDAQQQKTCVIEGETYQRIPYGREGRGWIKASRFCGDCGARKGQLHVPGCDLERCSRCRAQAISCGCTDAADGQE